MISTIAIVIAGISIVIVITTMYRNTSNPVPIIDPERGANGMVEIQITPTLECRKQEVVIVDSELNLIV